MLTHLRQAFALQLGNPTRKLVLLALANHANESGVCWPSIETLRLRAELAHKRAVYTHLAALEAAGFLSVVRAKGAVNRDRGFPVGRDHASTGDPSITSAPQTTPRWLEDHQGSDPGTTGQVIERSPRSTNEAPGKRPGKRPAAQGEASFQRFWEAYPRRDNKAAAEKAWDRLRPDTGLLGTILAALTWQKAIPQWQTQNYIPMPATYLNNRRWEDEPPSTATPSPTWRWCEHSPECTTTADHNRRWLSEERIRQGFPPRQAAPDGVNAISEGARG